MSTAKASISIIKESMIHSRPQRDTQIKQDDVTGLNEKLKDYLSLPQELQEQVRKGVIKVVKANRD